MENYDLAPVVAGIIQNSPFGQKYEVLANYILVPQFSIITLLTRKLL